MHIVNGQQKKPKKNMDTAERLGKSLFDGQLCNMAGYLQKSVFILRPWARHCDLQYHSPSRCKIHHILSRYCYW